MAGTIDDSVPINPFSYSFIDGSIHDCGDILITVNEPDPPLTPGSITDFIMIVGQNILVTASTAIGGTYYLTLQVSLVDYPTVTRESSPFTVTVNDYQNVCPI